jgi:ribosomal protein L16 Arg81 hydroxylase
MIASREEFAITAAEERQGLAKPALSLPNEWRLWVGENRLQGTSVDQIEEVLKGHGFLEFNLEHELQALESEVSFQLARIAWNKIKKLEALLRVKESLANLSSCEIAHASKLSQAEFLKYHYATNRPVVLDDALEDKSLLSRWQIDYLKTICEDIQVEVMSGRDRDPEYEVNSQMHKSFMRFSDYIAQMESSIAGNDCYLVANNHFFEKADLEILYHNLPKFGILDESIVRGRVFLWLGSQGTITPLHYDVMNVLVVQMQGRKRFQLLSPEQTSFVYNEIGVYSRVNAETPDLSLYPRFAEARMNTLILEPGQALFIPVGWWHQVRALEQSVTLSYINFAYPNSFGGFGEI